MTRIVTQPLAGWGNYPVEECRVYRPECCQDLDHILAGDCPRGLISRGLGRSYGDASLNENGGVVALNRLNRFLSFDPKTGQLECETGVTLAEILEVFLPRGYFVPVTPGTKYVTVGGAIAADVHGKNHHRDGTIATFVEDFRLLTGTGAVIKCSRQENAEAFWATIGGMGLTGIILSVRMHLRPVESAYLRVDYYRTTNLDETLHQFMQFDRQYTYSVAWIDCLASGSSLGRAVVIRADHAEAALLPASMRHKRFAVANNPRIGVPPLVPSFVLKPWAVQLFNNIYYRRHRTRPDVLVHYDPYFYPLDSVRNWNRIYGRSGFVQYQAAFPTHTSRRGLIALLEQFSQSRRASFLAVLKSFGPANEGMLSFPFAGLTLALDIPHNGDLMKFTKRLDQIVLRHDGRVYLAKDACLDAESLAAMYPQLPRFKRCKRALDPDQRFVSSMARRLGILDAA